MNTPAFKAKAYVKEGCPFSFKYWLFLVEAGLQEQVEVIRCGPEDADFEALKARLAAGLGKAPTFPTVEIEPGRYLSDSDALIDWHARRNNVDVSRLPALAFYQETIFPQVVELHEMKK
jgi:glutathione S-transferase